MPASEYIPHDVVANDMYTCTVDTCTVCTVLHFHVCIIRELVDSLYVGMTRARLSHIYYNIMHSSYAATCTYELPTISKCTNGGVCVHFISLYVH